MRPSGDTIWWVNSLLAALVAHGLAYLSLTTTWAARETAVETTITIAAPPRRMVKAEVERSVAMVDDAGTPVDAVEDARRVERPESERVAPRDETQAISAVAESQRLTESGTARVAEATAAKRVPVERSATTAQPPTTRPDVRSNVPGAQQAASVSTATPVAAPSTRDAEPVAVKTRSQNVAVDGEASTLAPTTSTRIASQATRATPSIAREVPPSVGKAPALRFGQRPQTSRAVAREPESKVAVLTESAPSVAGRIDGSDAGRTLDPVVDQRFERLLEFLAGFERRECAAVVPRVAPNGSVSLSGFAQNKAFWASFRAAAVDSLGEVLPVDAARVTPAQCAALRFATRAPSYPRFTLALDLESTDIRNGETLRARIDNVRGRHLHLLLVDDEGVVQSADRILQPLASGYSATFPVTLTAGDVETAQMLVAIAVSEPLPVIADLTQGSAAEFFAALAAATEADHPDADLALASFYVRR